MREDGNRSHRISERANARRYDTSIISNHSLMPLSRARAYGRDGRRQTRTNKKYNSVSEGEEENNEVNNTMQRKMTFRIINLIDYQIYLSNLAFVRRICCCEAKAGGNHYVGYKICYAWSRNRMACK
jgi:hypothetical protein